MAATLTINAVDKYADLGADWSVDRAANEKAALSAEILSDDGTYRPALDDEVRMTQDASTFFGGEIESARERGIGGSGAGDAIITEITARDFNARLGHRFVTAVIAAGSTVKQAAQVLVTFIPGTTLDVAQVDGPVLPELIWNDVLCQDAAKQVAELAGGWIVEVDADEVFRIYEPGTIAAPFNITLANQRALGDIIVEPTREGYANHVIVKNATFRKTATDAVAYAARPREMLVTVPDETPEDSVQATADTLLARALVQLKRVEYPTDEPGLKPGMTQVITYAPRNINNTFLVTDISSREVGGVLIHFVKAIEGLVYQTGWRETYRQWSGGAALSIAGAGGGGSTTVRYAVPLGGTGLDSAETDGVNWFPASGGGAIGTNPFQAQINTVQRGTTAATVTGRLRAEDAGVGVKARLYDVTDGVACAGESALVVDTAWQTVTFGATLTAGSHFYEVQVFSDTAGAWVRAAGFILE